MREEICSLYDYYSDWDLVIRHVFLFRILPAREYQKYLMSARSGVKFVCPFLEDSVIEKYFFIDRDITNRQDVFKAPIVDIARRYWPGRFLNVATSPFQVDFSVSGGDVKRFSLKKVHIFK